MAKNYTEQTTLLVLAGGRGSRFNNTDKGLLLLNKKPLVQHVVASTPFTQNILISANRNISAYQQLGFECISDDDKNHPGPMVAILGAAKHIKTKYVLVLACDTPLLPPTLSEQLLTPLINGIEASARYATNNGKGHYCCLAANVHALQQLRKVRSMFDLIRQLNGIAVEFTTDERRFININTEADLLRATPMMGAD